MVKITKGNKKKHHKMTRTQERELEGIFDSAYSNGEIQRLHEWTNNSYLCGRLFRCVRF